MTRKEFTEVTDTEQLHQDFLRDFTELLKKYNASFEMTEYDPYVCFVSVLDGDNNVVREESEIQLPDYINPN